ncbi:MAG: hypothetical protein R3D99_05140 [Altererythrobacter sp.]
MVFMGRGIRQPGGGWSIDSDVYFADQGGSSEHEISKLVPASTGAHFGWPYFEGTVQKQSGGPAGMIAPELVYPIGNGIKEGTGIVMGALYLGANASLSNKLVYGDRGGRIWSSPLARFRNLTVDRADAIENRTVDFQPDVGTIGAVIEIVKDGAGTLYILDAKGDLFRVEVS